MKTTLAHPAAPAADAGAALAQLATRGRMLLRQFNQRNQRERLLLIGAATAVVLMLADSLWLSPAPLWLLDEPYANLDLDGINLVNRMISAHLRDGGAALVTTHGAYAAPPVQTRMLVLERPE